MCNTFSISHPLLLPLHVHTSLGALGSKLKSDLTFTALPRVITVHRSSSASMTKDGEVHIEGTHDLHTTLREPFCRFLLQQKCLPVLSGVSHHHSPAWRILKAFIFIFNQLGCQFCRGVWGFNLIVIVTEKSRSRSHVLGGRQLAVLIGDKSGLHKEDSSWLTVWGCTAHPQGKNGGRKQLAAFCQWSGSQERLRLLPPLAFFFLCT